MPSRIALILALAAALALDLLLAPSLRAELVPGDLRTEYLRDPAAVDAAPPRLSWIVRSPRRAEAQTAYRVLAASDAAILARDEGNLWDSGKVASSSTIHVPYAGKPLASLQEVWWKVRVWDRDGGPSPWSEPASWRMGILDPTGWKARWVSAPGDAPEADEVPEAALGGARREVGRGAPAAHLRKEFRLERPVRRAIAIASALGLYELRLNGRRVGDHVLAPEWTSYRKRVQYQAHDVTGLLRRGENAVGAILADGWYAGRIGIHWIADGPARRIYGPRPLFLLQIEVELEDGTRETIVSDGTWKATWDGPIRRACILDGETVDLRRDLPGWDAPGFDDAAWNPVREETGVEARLVAQPNEPIRAIEDVRPAALSEPSPGVFIYDVGRNVVGWCRLRTRGPAGTRVVLRHAEMLASDGNVYTENLRSAAQADELILAGKGEETFEPRFTYHGFRYVEVRGLAERPTLDSLVARVVSSSMPLAATFECSSEGVTRLMGNVLATLRGNLHGVPTDCPQRDERLGWMGDAQVVSPTACFFLDMGAFWTKWLRDLRDDQARDGRFPDFAPHPYDPDSRFSAAPGWADAGAIVPWVAWVHYGDRRLLEESFDAARRWVEYIRSRSPELIWATGRGNDYNDWLNGDRLKLDGWPVKGAEVPKEVFATAHFARSTDLVARMARALGRDDEAARYGELAADIRKAFARAFVKEDGTILGGTQAGYALSLGFDLLPEELREKAAAHLVSGIEAYRGRASTGIHATIRLLLELSRRGRHDLACRIVTGRDVPSWLYMVDQGATTIWERWDGHVAGRGFQDPGMNSFNHFAFGSVGEWVWRTVVGLEPDEERPGYEHFFVRPRPGGDIRWARATHDSIRGRIAVSWTSEPEEFSLALEVPANAAATVTLPVGADWIVDETEAGREPESLRETGEAAPSRIPGLRLLARTPEGIVCRVESGRYELRARPPDARR